MAESKTTSVALAKWASQEVGFRCATQLDTEKLGITLLPLCKGAAMVNLWDEVVAHVKTKTKATEIRDNVELQKLFKEGKKCSQELAEVQHEAEALERDLESLQLQLRKYKEDLQLANLKLSSDRHEENLMCMRSCLTKQYSEYLKSKESGLKSFCKWFEELYQTYCFPASKADDTKSCVSEVNGICSLLIESFQNYENGQSVPDSTWSSIGNLLKNYSPESITICIQSLTENSTSQLKTDQSNIDFKSDLQNLEEKHHFCAERNGENNNQLVTLRKMLQEWDLECVKSHTEALICSRTAETAIAESDNERNRIITKLEKLHGNSPSTLQLAIDTLDAEVEFASVQGCMRSFKSALTRLQRDIVTKSQARDQLVKLREKINGFTGAVEANQTQIISSTKHNSTIKSRLTQRQEDVLKVAKVSVCNFKTEISKNCGDIHSAIQNRTHAFNLTDLNKLLVLRVGDGDETPQNHLSINRHGNIFNMVGGDAFQRALHALNVHHSILPSTTMLRVCQMQTEVQNFMDLKTYATEVESAGDRCHSLNALEEKCLDSEKKQLQSISAKFKTGSDIAKSAVEQADALEEFIDIWYNQPAQFQVSWLKADGLTLKEWRKKIDTP